MASMFNGTGEPEGVCGPAKGLCQIDALNEGEVVGDKPVIARC